MAPSYLHNLPPGHLRPQRHGMREKWPVMGDAVLLSSSWASAGGVVRQSVGDPRLGLGHTLKLSAVT